MTAALGFAYELSVIWCMARSHSARPARSLHRDWLVATGRDAQSSRYCTLALTSPAKASSG